MSEHPKDAHRHESDQQQDQEQHQEEAAEAGEGQVSEGPNSLSGSAADTGGADAIPDKTTGPGRSNQQH